MLPEDLLEQVFVRSTSTALLELSRTCQTFTSAVRKERWSPLDHNALLLLRLHVAGYVVLEKALPTLDPSILARLRRKRFDKIFNGMDEDGATSLGDGKRRACNCSSVLWQPDVERHTTLAATLGQWYRDLALRRGLLQVATPSVAK
jgi:hypothetical protein|tara:strand:+ start:453 stop:893 length:441 start_codon:yes stop_codon:yes gene_type:complete